MEVEQKQKCTELLQLVIDGQANEDQNKDLMSHLEECEHCREEYLLSKSIKESLKSNVKNTATPKGLANSIQSIISETVSPKWIKTVKPLGVVTCCGNVASPKLDLTVFPFILRGISLIGIDSQNYPMNYREQVWNKLADEWKLENLEDSDLDHFRNMMKKNIL